MAEDKVKSILETDFSKLPTGLDLYREFVKETEIEKFKEEQLVMRCLFQGKENKEIITQLQELHPDGKFTNTDLEKFIARNSQFVSLLKKEQKDLSRRHLLARVTIEEELAEATMFTKELVQKYAAQGDNTSTLQALKTYTDLLIRFGKITKTIDAPESQPTQQNVIQIISDKNANISHKIVEANFKMHKAKENIKNVTPDEKNSTEQSTENKA